MTEIGVRGLAAFGADAEILGLRSVPLAELTDAADLPAASGRRTASAREGAKHGAVGRDLPELGSRVRAARKARGLTGTELGDLVGLTKDKISKIESGKRRVDVSELAAIATALRTTVRSLLGIVEPQRPALAMAARLAPGAEAGSDTELRAKARQLLEFDDLLTRVSAMPAAVPSELGATVAGLAGDRDRFPARPRSTPAAVRQGRDLAGMVRETLNLGADSVGDLATLIEVHFPVDVALAPFGTSCDGLCVHAEGIAMVLASSDYVEGHVRFTLAHELGHHLLGDPRDVIAEDSHDMFDATDTVERRVNAFAGHFLMPETGIRQTLAWAGWAPGQPVTRRHLAALMEHFTVSRQALLYQLRLIGLLDRDASQRLEAGVTVKRMLDDNADVAPTRRANTTYSTFRSPQRLVRAARDAAQREVLGLGVVAALLGRDDDEVLWDEVMGENSSGGVAVAAADLETESLVETR